MLITGFAAVSNFKATASGIQSHNMLTRRDMPVHGVESASVGEECRCNKRVAYETLNHRFEGSDGRLPPNELARQAADELVCPL